MSPKLIVKTKIMF